MKKLTTLALTLALGSSALLTSCETGTATGALAGAALGGIIGGNTHGGNGNARILTGAAIGGLAGALAGSVYDADKRATQERYDRENYGGRERSYPYGEPTRYVGYVRSPYRPYNTIDVRGIPRGALVLDPSVDRPFRNP